MTTKLYDISAYDTDFTATVKSVSRTDGGYRTVLDRTLFFPTAGGQCCDAGTINGLPVLDVTEENGEILHLLPAPLPLGDTVSGRIDFAFRFRNMQHHTGEHVLSGIAHRLYGFRNVGFHLGKDIMTVDYDGVPPQDDYALLFRLANEAVTKNIPVHAYYPDKETLQGLVYRAKLDLTENVRIVEIPGIDVCACCAPHVAATGEVGPIHLQSAIHYKSGCRLTVICGGDAVREYEKLTEDAVHISRALSVPVDHIAGGVDALLAENGRMKAEIRRLRAEAVTARVNALLPTEGNILLFSDTDDMNDLRRLATEAAGKAGGMAVACAGDDEHGYRYVIASAATPLREAAKRINAALAGRGGGNDAVIQGSFSASRSAIEDYFT